MRSLILALLLTQTAHGNFSPFKGYLEVNNLIRERIILPNHKFDLGDYLNETYYSADRMFNLLDLLGTYKGLLPQSTFKNGTPNATNMLLWHIAFSGLSADMGALCTNPSQLNITVDFQEIAKNLCNPQKAISEDTMMDFWFALMGYESDSKEYEAWRDFILSEYGKSTRTELLQAMSFTIFNNPYFLLK